MISEQELLELVVALKVSDDHSRRANSLAKANKDNYSVGLDRDGNFTNSPSKVFDGGVAIWRDTFDVWGLSIRPASQYGPPMRYSNPVDAVRAARARMHGPSAVFLNQGEVRQLRDNKAA